MSTFHYEGKNHIHNPLGRVQAGYVSLSHGERARVRGNKGMTKESNNIILPLLLQGPGSGVEEPSRRSMGREMERSIPP
jgi:hypothetical protein